VIPLPLQLKEYFFPRQRVDANPNHDPAADIKVILDMRLDFNRVESASSDYGLSLTVDLDEDSSQNHPYGFSMQVFGVLSANDDVTEDVARAFGETQIAQMLIGAVREHLATLTARGPWGPYFMELIPIKPKVEDAESDQSDAQFRGQFT